MGAAEIWALAAFAVLSLLSLGVLAFAIGDEGMGFILTAGAAMTLALSPFAVLAFLSATA